MFVIITKGIIGNEKGHLLKCMELRKNVLTNET